MTIDRSKIRILLVDDDTDLLNSMRRLLINEGYQVAALSDPLTACRVLKRRPLDIVLSDIQMPGMDGLELMKVARQEQPGATRILVTGAATLEVVTAAINEGEVHRFVHKPFDITELKNTVAAAVQRHDEIRRAGVAAHRAESSRSLYAQLERQSPGILHVERDHTGAYVLDEERVRLVLNQREPALTADETQWLDWAKSWLKEPKKSRATAVLWRAAQNP